MANLKDIRNRIKSVQSIQQVTKAMKMVAAAKLVKSQQRMEQARPYENKLVSLIQSLLVDINTLSLSALEKREVKKICIVVVTGDRGLAGSFNINIIKETESIIDSIGKENVTLICICKKGFEYFKKRDFEIHEYFLDFWNELDYQKIILMGEKIINLFLNKSVDKIQVVYNFFENVGSQSVKSEQLLPIAYDKEEAKNYNIEKLYEPSKQKIVETLIPKHLNVQIWKYLLESFASEQAARMVAMENATENSKDMIKSLKLEFNKARQAAITTEMLEIVSGAEALN